VFPTNDERITTICKMSARVSLAKFRQPINAKTVPPIG